VSRPDPTPYELLVGRGDRTRPFLTAHLGPGQRIELSVATTANGVAKAAGLLRDGLGMPPGGTVSIDLPPHWQVGVWTLAALSAGARTGRHLRGPVEVRLVGPDALSASPQHELTADELLACSCDAFGMPIPGGVAPGVLDIGIEVRAHPDVLNVDPTAAATATLVRADGLERSWAELLRAALPLPASGPRHWVDSGPSGDGPHDLLEAVALRPLLAGGSVVLAVGLDPEQAARVRSAEGIPG